MVWVCYTGDLSYKMLENALKFLNVIISELKYFAIQKYSDSMVTLIGFL